MLHNIKHIVDSLIFQGQFSFIFCVEFTILWDLSRAIYYIPYKLQTGHEDSGGINVATEYKCHLVQLQQSLGAWPETVNPV